MNEERTIPYSEGIYPDKDWDKVEIPFSEDCIADKETAVQFADVILEGFQKRGSFENYSAQEVFLDTEDGIWIVSYWEEKPGVVIVGGGFNIAFRRDDCTVIKMWVEE